MSGAPLVKGWCPGAYRPMQSGDGLIVRVRPVLGRLTDVQLLGLSDLAARYGNGIIELTRRANLQIRGVDVASHDALVTELKLLDLLDSSETLERRRNILATPVWRPKGQAEALHHALVDRLADFPQLPSKFGFAVDTGVARLLTEAPADIRFERGLDGLILRADGVKGGRRVSAEDAIDAALDLAHWFVANARPGMTRMRQAVADVTLPTDWMEAEPVAAGPPLRPGPNDLGMVAGLAFGQILAEDLGCIAKHVTAIRLTPWRLVLLEDCSEIDLACLITRPDDPLLRVDACPGSGHCSAASVATRALARSLAPVISGSLHVSGCAKGCARSGAADFTLVGNDGVFDLIRDGDVRSPIAECGLRPPDLIAKLT